MLHVWWSRPSALWRADRGLEPRHHIRALRIFPLLLLLALINSNYSLIFLFDSCSCKVLYAKLHQLISTSSDDRHPPSSSHLFRARTFCKAPRTILQLERHGRCYHWLPSYNYPSRTPRYMNASAVYRSSFGDLWAGPLTLHIAKRYSRRRYFPSLFKVIDC
ncbi:hypothetical protein HZ326_24496 [Fusarium oxysporum f. sp. albedinis]|nr:Vegetative incompatibility protein HET-E-1 [Fusarium oxysporum f. sp. albedinis]KAJ0132434.1 hypothetical protein HZ326_24496 [Fusarium oxysporum f. sp. albedinis]